MIVKYERRKETLNLFFEFGVVSNTNICFSSALGLSITAIAAETNHNPPNDQVYRSQNSSTKYPGEKPGMNL